MKKTALQQAIEQIEKLKRKQTSVFYPLTSMDWLENSWIDAHVKLLKSLLPTEKEQIEESHIASMLNYHLTEYGKPADPVLVDTWKIDAAEYFTNTYGE